MVDQSDLGSDPRSATAVDGAPPPFDGATPPFDGAMAWSATRFNLAQGGQTEMVDGLWVSGSYFDVLGAAAILGRTFTQQDDRRGGGPDGPVAVISYSFWQRHFGGSAGAIGKPLAVERVTYTVIGVTPPGFFGTEVGRTFDVAIPLGTEPLVRGRESSLDRRTSWWLNIMLRLKRGQDPDAATAALRGLQPQVREATIPSDYRESDKQRYLSEPFKVSPAAAGTSSLRRRYQQPLTTLMVVVALVLVIACANIANLLLARGNARRHELSVRVALGASKLRIFRLLLGESLLLAGVAAVIGLLFAVWGSRLLVRQLSTATNTVFLDMGVDWRVLTFTAAVAIGTAVLFGVAPALRATRVQPNEALKEEGRGVVGEHFGAGNLLVIVQVALSVILVVAAGLFMRTFSSLATLDLGFDRNPVLVASVNAQRLQLEPGLRPELFDRLRRAAASVPGVAVASASGVTPVSGSTWQFGLEAIDGVTIPETDDFSSRGVYVNIVSPDWFKTYGTRLLGGRDFTDADTVHSPPVAVVNQAFARKFTGGNNPLGRRLKQMGFPGNPAVERDIVGYVTDAVYRSLREPAPATMYIPIPQQHESPPFISISVRSAGGSPALLTKSVASALTGVHKDVAITFRQLSEQVDSALLQERIVAMLSGFFGGLALLLAGMGLYGVTSVRSKPPPGRDRHPNGARGRPGRGGAPGAASRGAARRRWGRRGCGPERVGLPVRHDPAVRAAAAGSCDNRGRRARAVTHRRDGRVDSGTAGGAHRSGARPARRLGQSRSGHPELVDERGRRVADDHDVMIEQLSHAAHPVPAKGAPLDDRAEHAAAVGQEIPVVGAPIDREMLA